MRMRLKTAASAIAISTAFLTQNVAAQTERMRFEIEAKPVSQALQEFAVQSGYQMAFLANATAGARARSVTGTLSPEEALRRLLEGTGLEYRLINERTIAILEKTVAADSEGRAEEGSLRYASAAEQVQGPAPIQQLALAQTQTAQAQTQAAANESAEVEEIVVTGTRLAGTNLTSPVPVFQVGAAEFDSRGTMRVQDIINTMPQVTPGRGTDTDPRGDFTGTSTINLRSLEAKRTLVLLNGKRLPFGSPEISAANVDIIPAQLVERTDIVTGGGSAVYGADAVAGVVNFILKDDFEGVEIDSQVSFRQSPGDGRFFKEIADRAGLELPGSTSDGRAVSTNLTLGANTDDGKGNVTMFVGYENTNPFVMGDRVNGLCTLGRDPDGPGGVGCTGSSNFRRFITNDLPGTPENERLDLFQRRDGTLVPFVGAFEQTFNFDSTFQAQAKRERFNINALGHYDITDDVELYGDLSFMNNSVTVGASPDATFTFPFMTNCDNPLLQTSPAGELGNLFDVFQCDKVLAAADSGVPNPVTGEVGSVDIPFINSFRLAQGRGPEGIPLEGPNGPLRRMNNVDLTTWRVNIGFRGTIADTFQWDLFGQFARTTESRIRSMGLDTDRVQEALFVEMDPVTGEPVCRSGNPDCAPFNIFHRREDGELALTDAALNFTTTSQGLFDGETEQQVVGGTIQGNLGKYGGKSPAATSGISVLLGVEYREDSLEANPDKSVQTSSINIGDATMENLEHSKLEVTEIFMETEIPLIEDKMFFQRWSLNGAYRRSQYDVTGTVNRESVGNEFNTDTWFVGTTWMPITDVRFRAQFQRAVRAPNVIELFSPRGTGEFDLSGDDPCAGQNPRATFEQCARSGVTEEQFGNIPLRQAGTFVSTTGGNPELLPEVADTVTAGLQWTPNWLPGFSLSTDYFTIEIEDAISTVPPQTTLEQCVFQNVRELCDFINRDRFGTLFFAQGVGSGILATNVNIATLETSGVDFSVKYALDLSDIGLNNAGNINFDYAATWTTELETVPLPGGAVVDCQDKFGEECSAPNPAYKHRFLVTWNTPFGLQVNTTWRRIGDTDGFAPVAPIDEQLETQDYIDLSLSQQITDSLNVRLGVNNLFNTSPPITLLEDSGDGTQNGNTFPATFDIDRFIFFGVNMAF